MSRAGVRDAFQGHMYMYTVNSSLGCLTLSLLDGLLIIVLFVLRPIPTTQVPLYLEPTFLKSFFRGSP